MIEMFYLFVIAEGFRAIRTHFVVVQDGVSMEPFNDRFVKRAFRISLTYEFARVLEDAAPRFVVLRS